MGFVQFSGEEQRDLKDGEIDKKGRKVCGQWVRRQPGAGAEGVKKQTRQGLLENRRKETPAVGFTVMQA